MKVHPVPRRTILTYGAFDHLCPAQEAKLAQLARMGTELIVGCATDAFNIRKGIYATQSFEQRRAALERCGLVDRVIAEESWKQKRTDIINYNVCVLAVEDAWMGHFDDLRDIADVVYLSDVTEAGTQQGVVKAAFSQSA